MTTDDDVQQKLSSAYQRRCYNKFELLIELTIDIIEPQRILGIQYQLAHLGTWWFWKCHCQTAELIVNLGIVVEHVRLMISGQKWFPAIRLCIGHCHHRGNRIGHGLQHAVLIDQYS